jgi:hypothetical protein
MESFNNKEINKSNCKVCFTCKEYYEGVYCQTCYNNTYNIYNTTRLLQKYNIIPTNLFTKLLLIFSQIQTLYPWLHIINYDFILFKLLEYLQEPIFISIKYIIANSSIWGLVLKAIVCGLIIL